jgi:predicted Rdx family selenoprotein
MATEFWADFKERLAITLTPALEGMLEVYVGGEKVLDRKTEGGQYPEMGRVRQIRKLIAERLRS